MLRVYAHMYYILDYKDFINPDNLKVMIESLCTVSMCVS